jgi:phosphomannomutase
MVRDLVVSTLTGMGIDVIDLGLSTTPTVEVAVKEEKADGGIIITASHNPKEWNALKLLNSEGEFHLSRAWSKSFGEKRQKRILFLILSSCLATLQSMNLTCKRILMPF